MKKIHFLFFAAILMTVTISGCRKDVYGCTDPSAYNYNSGANANNGTCIYYGNLMFWCATNEGTITVTINGQSQTITGYVTGGVPNCNNAVSANFTLPAGYYNYNAASTNSNTWSGTAQVIGNSCQLYQLQ